MAHRRNGTEKDGAAQESCAVHTTRQRIDLFIWHTRFLRSRAEAAEMVRRGHARVNGLRVTQPGHALKCGDVLTLALPGRTRVIRVLAFAARRGPAETARALYAGLDEAGAEA